MVAFHSETAYLVKNNQHLISLFNRNLSSVATGQIMHRLKLTWLGNEGTFAQTTATFRTLLWIAISFSIIRFILFGAIGASSVYDWMSWIFRSGTYGPQKVTSRDLLQWGRILFNLSLTIFLVFLVAKTRKHIRSKYSIPEQSCHGIEDFCCAFWCNCCTVAQMARHTADYETYAALCCSETGQPHHVPSIETGQSHRVPSWGIV
mmetsp:Transcript_32830/g.53614  ORF Transcript_32830/g.53614 Transcript_32830/m.53614 type:complete len:205 (+) Transcript_32830:212-826(+)